jgi:hypothetical protein
VDDFRRAAEKWLKQCAMKVHPTSRVGCLSVPFVIFRILLTGGTFQLHTCRAWLYRVDGNRDQERLIAGFFGRVDHSTCFCAVFLPFADTELLESFPQNSFDLSRPQMRRNRGLIPRAALRHLWLRICGEDAVKSTKAKEKR